MLLRAFLVMLVVGSPAAWGQPSSAAPPAEKRTVMLLPVGGDAADEDRRGANEQLRAALGRFEGISLLGLDATERNVNDAADMGLACDVTDSACVSRLTVLMPTDQVIAPSVHQEAGAPSLTLELYDSQTGGLLQRVRRPLPPVGLVERSSCRR